MYRVGIIVVAIEVDAVEIDIVDAEGELYSSSPGKRAFRPQALPRGCWPRLNCFCS
jgi:hypothetical protein